MIHDQLIFPIGKIFLKKEKKNLKESRHRWIFSGAIRKIENSSNKKFENGDWIEVFLESGEFVGHAFYEKEYQIVARIFESDLEKIDNFENYWKKKFFELFEKKSKLFQDSNAFRLIHSESDGVPGIICDIYYNFCLIQLDYIQHRILLKILKEFLQEKGLHYILLKYRNQTEWLSQHQKQKIEFIENGILLEFNILNAQKTGYYLDQKLNKKKLQNYGKDKNVLDLFSYIGGFSLNAYKGGADEITLVDSSSYALEQANYNFIKNQFPTSKIQFLKEDIFDFLPQIQSNKYDLVILDPPALVKNKSKIKNAIAGYVKLNEIILRKIKKNGILFTFSCSQHISRNDFQKILYLAARQSRRTIYIMEYLNQSPDHSISISHPEGEYLKGFIVLIE